MPSHRTPRGASEVAAAEASPPRSSRQSSRAPRREPGCGASPLAQRSNTIGEVKEGGKRDGGRGYPAMTRGDSLPSAPSAGHNSAPALPIADTLALLECCVCDECMVSPIFQCQEGHTHCNQCHSKLEVCPVCRCENIGVRCRALERLADQLDEIECRFAANGCRATVKYGGKKDHEARCPHRPFSCLHVGCPFAGTADDLVAHLVQEHKYVQHRTGQFTFNCVIANGTQHVANCSDEGDVYIWQRHIYSCWDKHFLLRVHRKCDGDPQFFISVAGLHSRHHLNRYRISTAGNHRKYSFEGPVWSVRKGFAEIERVRDCLILAENIVLFLSGGKGSESDLRNINLAVEGEIYPPS